MAERRPVLHQAVVQEHLLALGDVTAGEQHLAALVDDTRRHRRMLLVLAVGEQAEDEEPDQDHQDDRLHPRTRDQQATSFSTGHGRLPKTMRNSGRCWPEMAARPTAKTVAPQVAAQSYSHPRQTATSAVSCTRPTARGHTDAEHGRSLPMTSRGSYSPRRKASVSQRSRHAAATDEARAPGAAGSRRPHSPDVSGSLLAGAPCGRRSSRAGVSAASTQTTASNWKQQPLARRGLTAPVCRVAGEAQRRLTGAVCGRAGAVAGGRRCW